MSNSFIRHGSSVNATFSSVLIAGYNLTKTGTNTLTLSGTNLNTDTVNVNKGVLKAGVVTSSFGNAPPIVMGTDSTTALDITGFATTIGSLSGGSTSGAGNITLGAAILTISNGGTNYSGVISGTGGLTLSSGTYTFLGSNTYTGTTTLNGGCTLSLGNTSGNTAAIASATVTSSSSGTLQFQATSAFTFPNAVSGSIIFIIDSCNHNAVCSTDLAFTGGLTVYGTDITIGAAGTTGKLGTNAIALSTARIGSGSYTPTLTFNKTGSTTVSNTISGTGNLTLTGSATISLSADNSGCTGTTTITSGTLSIGAGGAAGANFVGNIVNNSALIVNRTGTITIFNVISGSGTLTKSGSGTLILTGANNYSGTTTISASGGVLQVGNGGTVGTLGTNASGITVGSSGKLTFNRSDNITFSNAISGSGAIGQAGSGKVTLTGTNSQTGSNTVTAGTLQVGNFGTAGSLSSSGTTTVSTGAYLAFARSDGGGTTNVVAGTGTLQQLANSTLSMSAALTITNYEARAGIMQLTSIPTTCILNMYVDGDGSNGANNGTFDLTAGTLAVGSKTFNVVCTSNLTTQTRTLITISVLATGTPILKMNGTTRTSGVSFTQPLSGKTVTLTWVAAGTGLTITVV